MCVSPSDWLAKFGSDYVLFAESTLILIGIDAGHSCPADTSLENDIFVAESIPKIGRDGGIRTHEPGFSGLPS